MLRINWKMAVVVFGDDGLSRTANDFNTSLQREGEVPCRTVEQQRVTEGGIDDCVSVRR
jgi:hypothetical protein